MKNNIIILLAIAAIIAVAAGIYFFAAPAPIEKTSGTTGGQGTVAGEGSVISISGFKFVPATVNIKVGESVTWNNEDSASHSIISDSGTELASETFSKGETYTHTFTVAGTYDYHCGIHTSMKGRVVVS